MLRMPQLNKIAISESDSQSVSQSVNGQESPFHHLNLKSYSLTDKNMESEQGRSRIKFRRFVIWVFKFIFVFKFLTVKRSFV